MKPYRLAGDRDVFDYFDTLSKRERQAILDVFEHLAKFPNEAGEEKVTGRNGRIYEMRGFEGWRVTWWVDGPVREVRIIAVERLLARRRPR